MSCIHIWLIAVYTEHVPLVCAVRHSVEVGKKIERKEKKAGLNTLSSLAPSLAYPLCTLSTCHHYCHHPITFIFVIIPSSCCLHLHLVIHHLLCLRCQLSELQVGVTCDSLCHISVSVTYIVKYNRTVKKIKNLPPVSTKRSTQSCRKYS